MMGPHGDTSYANDILEGKLLVHQVDEWTNVKYRPELKHFLQRMKPPLDDEGNPIPDMKWDYGPDEFQQTFSKRQEDRACGPSGITMQFYPIYCLNDGLAKLHLTASN